MLARTVSTRVLGKRCFCSQLPVFPVGSHTLSYRGRLCFEWGLQLSPSRGRWCLCQKSQGPLVNGCTEAETRSSECALCRLCMHLCTCVPDLSGPPCRWMAQQWWQIVSVYLRERGLWGLRFPSLSAVVFLSLKWAIFAVLFCFLLHWCPQAGFKVDLCLSLCVRCLD